jgi:hypothetical protein
MVGVGAGAGLITLAYALAFTSMRATVAPVSMLAGLTFTCMGALALGAPRSRLALAGIALTGLLLAGTVGASLVAPPPTADATLWLGLPRATALVVYGVGVLPLVILPLVYALTHRSSPRDR